MLREKIKKKKKIKKMIKKEQLKNKNQNWIKKINEIQYWGTN